MVYKETSQTEIDAAKANEDYFSGQSQSVQDQRMFAAAGGSGQELAGVAVVSKAQEERAKHKRKKAAEDTRRVLLGTYSLSEMREALAAIEAEMNHLAELLELDIAHRDTLQEQVQTTEGTLRALDERYAEEYTALIATEAEGQELQNKIIILEEAYVAEYAEYVATFATEQDAWKAWNAGLLTDDEYLSVLEQQMEEGGDVAINEVRQATTEEAINDCEQRFQAQLDKVRQIESDIAEAKTQLENLETQLTELDTAIAANQERIAELEEQRQALEDAIKAQEEALEQEEQALNEIECYAPEDEEAETGGTEGFLLVDIDGDEDDQDQIETMHLLPDEQQAKLTNLKQELAAAYAGGQLSYDDLLDRLAQSGIDKDYLIDQALNDLQYQGVEITNIPQPVGLVAEVRTSANKHDGPAITGAFAQAADPNGPHPGAPAPAPSLQENIPNAIPAQTPTAPTPNPGPATGGSVV